MATLRNLAIGTLHARGERRRGGASPHRAGVPGPLAQRSAHGWREPDVSRVGLRRFPGDTAPAHRQLSGDRWPGGSSRSADDNVRATAEVMERFDVEALQDNGTLRIEVPDGAEFVPQVVRSLSVPVKTVTVRRPSLDDVFLKLTRRAIRDERADGRAPLRISLAQPLLYLLVFGVGLSASLGGGPGLPPGVTYLQYLYPGGPGDGGAVHRHVQRHVGGVGP